MENALLKMKRDGVIERVSSANSAAPILVVGKKDSADVLVCGDFSVTYNASARVETYPMPQIKDMHTALGGCTVVTVLDMKQAYRQVPIARESQSYLTIRNRPYSYSKYWTGTSLQWRLMRGNIIKSICI